MSFPMQRIQNLATRLGISFQEAAARCARKGARKVREKKAAQAAMANEQRIQAARWDLKD